MNTYHVRTPQPRRGGNQFYRDKRVFDAFTLCGAAVTDHDRSIRDVNTKLFQCEHKVWEAREGWTGCPDCLQKAVR